jgi:hypothetical protein
MWWDVVYGRSNVRVEGLWAQVDTQKSNTIVLAVPIALTLKVKMNCIAILALLCCTHDDFDAWCIVVDCGVRAIHAGLELVRRWTHKDE